MAELVKENPVNEWRLQKIEIEYQRYGANKGMYEGKIRFQNDEYESFDFKISPEMAQSYLDLIGKNVVESAESLGSKLIDSLGLKKGITTQSGENL